MSLSLPESKRRKVVSASAPEGLVITKIGTEIRLDGTMTPLQTVDSTIDSTIDSMDDSIIDSTNDSTNDSTDDNMDTSISPFECPCGYLHGPGSDHFHDISAVGFSADVMKGP